MKSIWLSAGFVGLLIAAGIVGLAATQPGITLVALCASPLAFMVLGWALGRSGLRVSVSNNHPQF